MASRATRRRRLLLGRRDRDGDDAGPTAPGVSARAHGADAGARPTDDATGGGAAADVEVEVATREPDAPAATEPRAARVQPGNAAAVTRPDAGASTERAAGAAAPDPRAAAASEPAAAPADELEGNRAVAPSRPRLYADSRLDGPFVITGYSGAGKSGAMAVFEDAGYFCVDILPPEMIRELVGVLLHEGLNDAH